jgi:hypothetical protein
MNNRGQSALHTIGILFIVFTILVFVGDFFGVAADSNSASATSGFGGFFFSNWNMFIYLGFFVAVAWMVYFG